MITVEEARKLREQLRPAFAGYLTDGNISDRDVLATLLDLVIRGPVLLATELKDEKYRINKIVKMAGTEESLLPFEHLFLKELFKKSNEVTPDEFKEIVRSRKLHKIIEDNLGALKDIEIVKTELKFIKNDRPIYFSMNKQQVNSIEEAKKFYGSLKIISFFVFILLVGGTYTIITSPDFNPDDLILFYCIFAAIIGGSVFVYHSFKKSKKVLELKMKVVPAAKKKYEELFKFIQKYPLAQQRLDNEFMPFAVAFGLDTSWNKSFGITEEMVVISEAGRSDSQPAIPRK